MAANGPMKEVAVEQRPMCALLKRGVAPAVVAAISKGHQRSRFAETSPRLKREPPHAASMRLNPRGDHERVLTRPNSIEGEIARAQAERQEAEARLRELANQEPPA